ncbi:hypothetical protein J4Q44_G00120690 [Coregonus suidteri]|uniref:Uncharacterized protein n=1 Tax=Coregonus suidteri TaxID=861788 RepID=A0AAN8QUT5_9TELE
MADDKSLRQLKDLAELKDQLEDIQKRVEKEVQAGIPQGGSVLPLLSLRASWQGMSCLGCDPLRFWAWSLGLAQASLQLKTLACPTSRKL